MRSGQNTSEPSLITGADPPPAPPPAPSATATTPATNARLDDRHASPSRHSDQHRPPTTDDSLADSSEQKHEERWWGRPSWIDIT
ncbi:MAG: hypothetical protein DLM61_11975 [Pseudonocardiales bacterium]|nr:MAG: hypothetical protein DLM61_11975 [Pseudonocardiales bacterium]